MLLSLITVLQAKPVQAKSVQAKTPPLELSTTTIGPALWLVSDEDSQLWLFGSIHALPSNISWYNPALKEVMKAAEVVYFEASTDEASQQQAQAFVLQRAINPPGESLIARLTPEGQQALHDAAQAFGSDIRLYDQMQPWFAFMTLGVQAAIAAGFDPESGVDKLLNTEAIRLQKDIRYFETLVQQTAIFSDLSELDQLMMLEAALSEVSTTQSTLKEMLSAWLIGDIKALEATAFKDIQKMPPRFVYSIYYDRNLAWTKELDRYLQGSGTGLVVVGAAHLVGEDSLPDLLAKRGWKVERR